MSNCRPDSRHHNSRTTIPTIGYTVFPSKCRPETQAPILRTTLSTNENAMFPVWQVCRSRPPPKVHFLKILYFSFFYYPDSGRHLRHAKCNRQSRQAGTRTNGNRMVPSPPVLTPTRMQPADPADTLLTPLPAACGVPGGDVASRVCPTGRPRRSARQRPENRPALDWTVRAADWWWCSIPSMI